MNTPEKVSRCGFAIIKLRVENESLYLMRRSKKWRDVSFIGGHEISRDAGKLSRTTYRELLEEVPALRQEYKIELSPLTEEFGFGPTYSPSAEAIVAYELQFFMLNFFESPIRVLLALGSRSPNILLSEDELLRPARYRIAGLVSVLDRTYRGGIQAMPLSWDADLGAQVGDLHRSQLELKLTA